MSKILLLLEHKENRRLLSAYLERRYEILSPSEPDALNREFDLCILDGPTLDRLWEQIEFRKQTAPSLFLPFLLVTPRRDVNLATRFLWKIVDDLIISPVHKVELLARVESLLLARRLATAFPNALAEHANLSIIVLDREGAVRYWSPASERIFGWTAEEVLGKPYPAVPPTEEQRYHDLLARILQGERLADVEALRQRKDGSLIDTLFSAAPLRDDKGNITHAMSLTTDVTEHKRARQLAERRFNYLQTLRQIDSAIVSGFDTEAMLKTVLEHVKAELGADAADVLLFNPVSGLLEFAAGIGFRSEMLQHTRLSSGEGFAGQALHSRRVFYIPEIARGENRSLEQTVRLSQEGFIAYAGAPLIVKDEPIGVLEIFHRSALDVSDEWLMMLSALAGQAAIAVNDARLYQDLRRAHAGLALAYEETLEGWAAALDLRDKETEEHTRRVTEYFLKLARAAGVSEEEQKHAWRGAILHDIGKIGVPDSVLLKPDKLNDEEWAIMRRHPQFAYDMLSRIAYLRPALDVPYCHHEKWDGSGYPRGLKGEEIPFLARLFAIVDVWDALRSDRPYRKGWTEEEALEYVRSQSGKHFDPRVVELFLKILKDDADG